MRHGCLGRFRRALTCTACACWGRSLRCAPRLDDEPLPLVEGRDDDAEVPQLSALRARPSLDAVVTEAARLFGDDPAAWTVGRRCNGMGRPVAAYLARLLCRVTASEIAARLGYRHASSVSAACLRVDAAMKSRRFAGQVDRLRHALSANG